MKLHLVITALLISCIPAKGMDQTPEHVKLCQQIRECHRAIVEKTGGGLFGVNQACEQRKKAQEQANRDGRNTCIAYAIDTAIIGVLVAVIYYNR